MVRRIRSCASCCCRFVSEANSSLCCACKEKGEASSSFEPNLKRAKVTSSDCDDNSISPNTPVIDLCDENFPNDEDAVSEGGDDIHCTQILEVDEKTDEIIAKDQNQTPQVTKSPPESKISSSTNDNNDDICFICGVLLSGLKRRVDHIKRCSKKHLITGRDVVHNDHDAFATDSTTNQTSTSNLKNNNPYSRDSSSWHGDATLALRLADQHEPSKNTSTMEPQKKQTSLTSFLQAPIRNVNNVLLAGARRVSKVAEVVASRKSKDPEKAAAPYGRFGKRRRDYSKFECPMYKKIPGTDFNCDGFLYAKSSSTKNYFLSHFHSDHYGGINSSWNSGIIYCSLPTATLVAQQLGVDKKYIHPIAMLTPTVIESRGKPITVTLIDANHCPGAVMFLFELGKRKILHVGDFRWNREFMLRQAPLRPFFSKQTTLDELFLDTTYCDPKYRLPSQEEAIKAIIASFESELDRCRQNQCKTLHLFGAYTIGKEKIYISVAEHFGMKVYVDSSRFKILSALNWPKEKIELLTTNKEETCIWVVPLGHINMKKLREYFPTANSKPFSRAYDQIVAYRPTGWSLGSKPSASLISSRRNDNIAIHSVPYSEHSSFPELVDCLECLKPQRIVPTVNASKSSEQVTTLLTALRQKQSTLPFTDKH